MLYDSLLEYAEKYREGYVFFPITQMVFTVGKPLEKSNLRYFSKEEIIDPKHAKYLCDSCEIIDFINIDNIYDKQTSYRTEYDTLVKIGDIYEGYEDYGITCYIDFETDFWPHIEWFYYIPDDYTGSLKTWFDEGKVRSITEYINGKKVKQYGYFDNGKKYYDREFENGRALLEKQWFRSGFPEHIIEYNENGKEKRKFVYSNKK